ncbi:MAG: glutathione S-transferase family protein [Marivita sp. XM-24bin2]|jgi:glutathione S-transferase|nr:MAG: glutathione S-transferase family protein [Marivita sp. XM-24bin2]
MAAIHYGVAFTWQSWNPFADPEKGLHPFARVPVWLEDDLTIYETSAILTYLDARSGVSCVTPLRAARVQQVASVVDSYGYWPLIRQVYAHAVYRRREGLEPDIQEVEGGMAQAPTVLAELDAFAKEGHVLNGQDWCRADWHLAPMIAAFVQHPPAADLLAEFTVLSTWYDAVRHLPAFAETERELT